MIRVNLSRNRVGDTQTVGMSPTIESGSESREALVRLLVIFIFTGGLMVYENQALEALNVQKSRLMTEVAAAEQQAAAKAKEAESVKDVESEAKELEDKLKILTLLSKLRLREVKTLDFIQSAIPEKVWIKDFHFESDKAKVDEGRFAFKGGAVSTEDLTEFVKRLEESNFLNEVIVIKNQETTASGRTSSVFRDYEFTALVEVKR